METVMELISDEELKLDSLRRLAVSTGILLGAPATKPYLNRLICIPLHEDYFPGIKLCFLSFGGVTRVSPIGVRN